LDQEDRLQPVANQVIPLVMNGGFSAASERDRVFYLAWAYAAELGNGGHAQFFFNDAGEYTVETATALIELGLVEHAGLLQEAAVLLFGVEVPRSLRKRNKIIANLDEAVEQPLERLDDRFFAIGGDEQVYERLSDWYFGEGRA
jgi:uncharacterized protein DUF4375